jgi:hypothetical protein
MSNFGVSIANVRTTESVEAQYNPERLRETVSAQMGALEILGHSHPVLQYRVTSQFTIEGVDWRFDARSSKNGYTREAVLDARKFFHSLQYAPQGQDVVSGGVDELIFVWPNLYSLRCYLRHEGTDLLSFAPDGSPERFVVRTSVLMIAARRITSEDVRRDGMELAR